MFLHLIYSHLKQKYQLEWYFNFQLKFINHICTYIKQSFQTDMK